MTTQTKLPVPTRLPPEAAFIDLQNYQPAEIAVEDFLCGACGSSIILGTNVNNLEELYKGHLVNNYVKCPNCEATNGMPHLPQAHPSFKEPSEKKIKIWKYMDLAKFLSLIQRGALFFPKTSLLGDPYEGSTPRGNRASIEFIINNRTRFGDKPPFSFFKNMDDQQARSYLDQTSQARRTVVDWFRVSCWHMNEFESAAMWKLYTLAHESICIQTSYDKLRLHMPTSVHIGMIRYIDYNVEVVDENNAFNFIMIKRRSFDHERELRAVSMHAEDPSADGIWIETNLSLLLDNVYLSPTAPAWFLDSVAELSKHYGLTVPVSQSMLGISPIY